MNILWVICALGLAGASAYIICRHFSLSLRFPENLLIWAVLFIVFHLLPVHLSAALELIDIIEAVTLFRIVVAGAVILTGLMIYTWEFGNEDVRENSAAPLDEGKGDVPSSRLPNHYLAMLVVVVVSWLIFAFNLFTSYPAGWDTLSYHLPVAVRWLQEQSLRIPLSGAWEYSLPENVEISMLLLLATGGQRIATLINIPAFLIAAAATYLIALRVMRKKLPALLTLILFISLPIIQFQAVTGYVDLYGSSCILAGLATLLRRLEPPRHHTVDVGEKSPPPLVGVGLLSSLEKCRSKFLFDHRRNFSSDIHLDNPVELNSPALVGGVSGGRWYLFTIVIAGCAWGVAMGTKPTFYVYSAVCFLCAAVLIWREQKHHQMSKVLLITLLIISMLLPSAFWFFRAVKTTGNPVYPIKVELFGKTIFDGFRTEEITSLDFEFHYVRSRAEWLVYPWVEYKSRDRSYRSGVGLGAFWATFVPLGMIYGIYLISRKLLLGPVCGDHSAITVGPERCHPERSRRAVEGPITHFRLYLVLMVVLFLMSVVWWFVFRRMPRFGVPLIALACILTTPLFDLLIRRQPKIFWWIALGAVVVTSMLHSFDPVHKILGRLRTGGWDRASVYEYPEIFDRLPRGTVVWNVSTRPHKNFPLAGKYLSNTVIPVNWRRSQSLSAFIRQYNIEYIADISPFCSEDLGEVARIVFEGKVGSGQPWRVWKVGNVP